MKPLLKKGLMKVGDAYLPGQGVLPRFSRTDALHRFPELSSRMTPQDQKDIALVFSLLGALPGFFSIVLVYLLELSPMLPTWGFGVFRLLRLGLKGVIMTLYYSEESIHEAIGFDLKRF